MERLLDETAPTLEHLAADIKDLQRRLAELERRNANIPEAAGPDPAGPIHPTPNANWTGVNFPTGFVPVIGTAVLGMAGAYLLRALTESGSVPRGYVVAVALLYAAAWLVSAVRTRPGNEFAAATYGVTAALILAPMLWETTVGFAVMPAPAAALTLVLFAAFGSALAWRRNLTAVTRSVIVAATGTAVALIPGTGHAVPFTIALLVIALGTECAACSERWTRLRPVSAIASDFAIGLLIYLFTRSGRIPDSYQPVSQNVALSLSVCLAAIYSGSIIYRTVVRRRPASIFEIWQLPAAFALAIAGALQAGGGNAAIVVGGVSVVFSAASYSVAFLWFRDSHERNRHVYATFGMALLLIGTPFLLPATAVVLVWCVAAISATLRAVRMSHPVPAWHATTYLVTAALLSGLVDYIRLAMTGAVPSSPPVGILIAATVAMGCYGIWWWSGAGAWSRPLPFVVATLATAAVAALLVTAAVQLLSRVGALAAPMIATLRMLVMCGVALALGYFGSRWGRKELVWVAYVAIAFGTLKLVLEDFRLGHPAAFAVSLLCYGAVLVVIPRLVKTGIKRV